jgi:hypothetical protein
MCKVKCYCYEWTKVSKHVNKSLSISFGFRDLPKDSNILNEHEKCNIQEIDLKLFEKWHDCWQISFAFATIHDNNFKLQKAHK